MRLAGETLAEDRYEIGDDGLIRERVGDWAAEKHDRLRKYIDIARGARRMFLTGPSRSASYIDLFCGPGQCRIRGTQNVIDGSPLVAFKSAAAGSQRFSEIFLGDINGEAVAAARARLAAIGGAAHSYVGSAEQTAHAVVRAAHRYGLHFALLDPYSIESLNFEIIATLAELKHIDMLLHVSAMDLQRNLDAYAQEGATPFDAFAPGWRAKVDLRQALPTARAALLNYWASRVETLGFAKPRWDLVTTSGGQRLYWLAFISREPIANKFWNQIRYVSGQADLLAGL